ncbi:MAG TPA: polymer-forming cytoskeletal protein [Longimicrobiaceae bacterium]|nr:polymer-forming cytoskeletal protein [Longimicrobiaceae bacterium]
MTAPRPGLLLALLVCALATVPPLRAQEVRLEGMADSRAVRLVREILAAENYLRLDRDTVLSADFRTAGDLLVVDADVRLEGTVQGSVAVLGGALYVRPGATVIGPIVNLGGEVYPSGLAEIGEIVGAEPDLRVAVELDGAGARVRVTPPPGQRPRLAWPGFFGVRIPTYDRVNGLNLSAGPSFLVTGDPQGPRLDAWLTYYTARSDFGGGVAARTPIRPGVRLEARAERAVFTNEAWARGDLSNTLGSLLLGNDYRDYWESDRLSVTLERFHEEPLAEGELVLEPRISVMAMRDRSLRNRNPWSLLGDLDRANLPVLETEWASALAGTGFRWVGRTAAFTGDAALERAIPGVSDGVDFTQWTADGLWTMQALWRHTLGVRFHALGTLGGEAAPPQRWSFVGGSPTLTTLEVAELRGDNLVFVESTYGIPLPPRLALPVLGPPTFRLTHAVGSAWVTGEPVPAWEQNLGAGLFFSVARVEFYINPAADGLDPEFTFGVVLPSF